MPQQLKKLTKKVHKKGKKMKKKFDGLEKGRILRGLKLASVVIICCGIRDFGYVTLLWKTERVFGIIKKTDMCKFFSLLTQKKIKPILQNETNMVLFL